MCVQTKYWQAVPILVGIKVSKEARDWLERGIRWRGKEKCEGWIEWKCVSAEYSVTVWVQSRSKKYRYGLIEILKERRWISRKWVEAMKKQSMMGEIRRACWCLMEGEERWKAEGDRGRTESWRLRLPFVHTHFRWYANSHLHCKNAFPHPERRVLRKLIGIFPFFKLDLIRHLI